MGLRSEAKPEVTAVEPGTIAAGMILKAATLPVKPEVVKEIACVDPAVITSAKVAALDRAVPAVPPIFNVTLPADRVAVYVVKYARPLINSKAGFAVWLKAVEIAPAAVATPAAVVQPVPNIHGITLTLSIFPVKPAVVKVIVPSEPATIVSTKVALVDRAVPAVPPRLAVIVPAETEEVV